MVNLRGVDLNLLPVFEAAYEERSLSCAATRLATTQPAVSQAPTRWRALFEDELFVRQSRGVAPRRRRTRPTPGSAARSRVRIGIRPNGQCLNHAETQRMQVQNGHKLP